jgi:hypothetical protein
MEDDDNNREEINNKVKEIKENKPILKEEINNKVKEIRENKLILKEKLDRANNVLNDLLVAQKAYDDAAKDDATKDDATTEEEKKQVLEELLRKYNSAAKDYYDYDEDFINLIKSVENEYNIKAEEQEGGKRKSKGKSKKVSKKPVVSQKKQSEYKEILGKKMKIYKMPDSRKEYVKYKGELHHITHYKNLMKQKAAVKAAVKAAPKAAPKLRNKI